MAGAVVAEVVSVVGVPTLEVVDPDEAWSKRTMRGSDDICDHRVRYEVNALVVVVVVVGVAVATGAQVVVGAAVAVVVGCGAWVVVPNWNIGVEVGEVRRPARRVSVLEMVEVVGAGAAVTVGVAVVGVQAGETGSCTTGAITAT